MSVLTDFRAVCLPYCLERQPSGRWVVLNRRYKPIGFGTSDRVDYSAYPIAHELKLTKSLIAKLAVDQLGSDEKFCLYNDDSSPLVSTANMAAYLHKLELLAKLSVRY